MTPPAGRFRKRPVEVDAARWFRNGDHPHDGVGETVVDTDGTQYLRREGAVVRYFRTPDTPGTPDTSGTRMCRHCARRMSDHGWIDTLEGGHVVCPGDWIVTGVRGERYPRKDPIFRETYEPVRTS